MEPKYLTLIQAAAIAALLAIVVVTYEPPTDQISSEAKVAVTR
ncbi:MAG TPA: hypothetical protein PK735_11780 [Flavobacteriales bacterium]|nr:hypothetical protein [Flavobacteriales bacterium]HQX28474.1 hypothetical protein [Flavobacteriales bacterium]HQX37025.1 hypothetical protein [Flavobacteriales bacterium]HQZ43558.1 hypothetical protein [Flavobacteriales bacterium]HQZ91713.1 hypothetical protein [Flavobacteriales bacterium]